MNSTFINDKEIKAVIQIKPEKSHYDLPKQEPMMAATTGFLLLSRWPSMSWPVVDRVWISASVLHADSMLMSAPAMKLSGFPDIMTADLMFESAST